MLVTQFMHVALFLVNFTAFTFGNNFLLCFLIPNLQVRQWIADRVTENSSPVSPSTSSSYPGPSPSSDWSNLQRDKSSPLRGPHGKFVSPISTGGRCSSSSSPPEQVTPQRPRGERHTDMAELAKHVSDP